MTLEQMHNSVRAGFSGNDPLGKLGLFGMGFNISTARLGRVTTVLSTRKGDPYWVVLELDLDEMQKTGQFSAKISKEPKDNDDIHGTIVEVKRLKPEFRSSLTEGLAGPRSEGNYQEHTHLFLQQNPLQWKLQNLKLYLGSIVFGMKAEERQLEMLLKSNPWLGLTTNSQITISARFVGIGHPLRL